MPRIELLPQVLYEAMQPYHVNYDNLPLRSLFSIMEVVNSVVDRDSRLLREAVGDAGSLGGRLDQSLDSIGDLIPDAVDATMHSIEAHEDTEDYVRMLQDERDKLDLISTEATALTIALGAVQFPPDSLTKSTLKIEDSESITWELEAPNILKAHMAFPAEAAHLHFYEYSPVWVEDTLGKSYFKTTSVGTHFIEGSLRVYVNGFRIFSNEEVYVPDADVEEWYSTKFTPHPDQGTFEINRIVSDNDVIYIDFDTSYDS